MVDNYTNNRFSTLSVLYIGLFCCAFGFLVGRARELERLEKGV